MGGGCRTPALEVLALHMIRSPDLATGPLESAGARLQHLQLVIAEDWAGGGLWAGFWRAAKACTHLADLQLVFLPESAQAVDQQVVA